MSGSKVVVKMKLSQADTGKLYMKYTDLKEEIKLLKRGISEEQKPVMDEQKREWAEALIRWDRGDGGMTHVLDQAGEYLKGLEGE